MIIFIVKIGRGALCALSLYDQDACCSQKIASFKNFSEQIFSAGYHKYTLLTQKYTYHDFILVVKFM